jgi:phosphoesterase RecJ-like protein
MNEPFAYRSNATPDRLAARIRGGRRLVVTSHAKPDGDALGSVLAVIRAANALGIAAEGWLIGPFEPNLLSLAEPTPLIRIDPAAPRLPTAEPDLIVIVDTGAWSQLEPLAAWLRPRVERAIGIDHHARGDLVAAERVVDIACGSTTAVLVPILDALGVPLTTGGDADGRGSVAEALFLGLATDTGWFRFQNARPAEFALAGRLLAAGVDKDRLYAVVEQSQRRERLAIEARALGSARFLADGGVALMSLALADFAATGATLEETGGVVNLPMSVASVRVSALLIESEPGLVKVSFRSKPKADGARFFDVNEIAARFGGGGHVHAAGARIRGSLAEATAAVERALTGTPGHER